MAVEQLARGAQVPLTSSWIWLSSEPYGFRVRLSITLSNGYLYFRKRAISLAYLSCLRSYLLACFLALLSRCQCPFCSRVFAIFCHSSSTSTLKWLDHCLRVRLRNSGFEYREVSMSKVRVWLSNSGWRESFISKVWINSRHVAAFRYGIPGREAWTITWVFKERVTPWVVHSFGYSLKNHWIEKGDLAYTLPSYYGHYVFYLFLCS